MVPSPEAFSIPSSVITSDDVGGTPTSIVKLLSSWTITFTGTCIPLKSAVFAFISSTTALIFTPSGPRAGPSGGPGFALPPGTNDSITFAI